MTVSQKNGIIYGVLLTLLLLMFAVLLRQLRVDTARARATRDAIVSTNAYQEGYYAGIKFAEDISQKRAAMYIQEVDLTKKQLETEIVDLKLKLARYMEAK